MPEIPTIEPFQFIRSTAFSERVQLANKLNEVIDALNQIGTVDDLQSQIDNIKGMITQIQADIADTDSDVSDLSNQVNELISEVNTTIKQSISALESEVDGIDTRLTTAESTISEHGTEIDGLLKEVVDGVAMSSTAHGTVQVQINHEDGSNDISAPIDLGLVEEGGIVLQSGTTDRSFKLIVTLTDGTSWQTNDFVIPEGGGTEVSVTSISIAQGTGTDKIQVKIGLSDGSTISSNDWTVVTPSEFSALGTRVTTAEGNITKNTGDIADLETRVQTIEDSPGYALQPATATTLGGVKIGKNITVSSDGTISVPIAGTNLGLVKNGGNVVIGTDGTMNITLPSVPTEYLKNATVDIVGTSKTATFTVTNQANAAKGIIIQKGSDANIIKVMDQSGTNVTDLPLIEDVTVQMVNENTLRIEVNGISGEIAIPSSGAKVEFFDIDNTPVFKNYDILILLVSNQSLGNVRANYWNSPIVGNTEAPDFVGTFNTMVFLPIATGFTCSTANFGLKYNSSGEASLFWIWKIGAASISVWNDKSNFTPGDITQLLNIFSTAFNGDGATFASTDIFYDDLKNKTKCELIGRITY